MQIKVTYSSQRRLRNTFAEATSAIKDEELVFPNGLKIRWSLDVSYDQPFSIKTNMTSKTNGNIPTGLMWSFNIKTKNYITFVNENILELPWMPLNEDGPTFSREIDVERYLSGPYRYRSLRMDAELKISGDPSLLEAKNQPSDFLLLKDVMPRDLYSDFTIIFGDQEFKTHKIVIAARSPFFRRMLQNDCQESSSLRVEIPDIDPDVFGIFLDYFYSSTLVDLTGDVKKVFDLLKLADMYEVETLKDRCSNLLWEIVADCDVKTAAEIYYMASKLSCKKDLVAEAFEKIQENFKRFSLEDVHQEKYKEVYELTLMMSSLAAGMTEEED